MDDPFAVIPRKPRAPRKAAVTRAADPLEGVTLPADYDLAQGDTLPMLDQEESELDRVFAELGGESNIDAKVIAYRIRKDTPKDIYLFECTPSEFSLQLLAERYGGGRFRVRVYVRRENGQRQLAANQLIEIEPPLAGSLPGKVDGASVPSRIDAFMDRFEAGQLGALANPAQAANPLAQFRDMLTLAAMMKDAFSSPAQNPTDPLIMLKTMREMKELGRDLFGSDGGAAPQSDLATLANTARDFLPVIRDAMHAPQAAQAMQPAPASQPAAIAAPVDNEGDEMSMMIGLYLKQLTRKAAANAETATQAEALLDLIPEDKHGDFIEMLESEKWFTELSTIQPAIGAHQEWFTRLRADILGAFDDDFTTAPQSGKTDPVKTPVPAK